MRHPTEGVLRRLLDEPAGVTEHDRTHVAACADCLGSVAVMRHDAGLVAAALSTDGADDVDIDAAWARLHGAALRAEHGERVDVASSVRHGNGRLRELMRRPIVAGVAVAVVLTGAGTAAANNWFEIFRTEKVAPIVFSAADLNALPDLRAYGDVDLSGPPNVRVVADAAAASAETGLAVPQVRDLPRGVRGEPVYQVGDEVTATFTFSTERAAEAAARAGAALPPPPPGLDGSQVRLVAGPGVVAIWSQPAGVPSLVVGRAVAPKAFSTGVEFEVMRDYLLSLPAVPDNVAAQLRAFAADGSTLPLPVPANTTSSAEVNGAPATVLVARDRTIAAVVWAHDGVMNAVAGALDVDEVLSIARGLR